MKHYPTNIKTIETFDGGIKIEFDCSKACGMTGDWTVGRTNTQARARAKDICDGHTTIAQRASAGWSR